MIIRFGFVIEQPVKEVAWKLLYFLWARLFGKETPHCSDSNASAVSSSSVIYDSVQSTNESNASNYNN